MVCHDLGPGLLDVFQVDFGNKLKDDAARELRRSKKAGSDQANGFHVGENAWMQAFSQVCCCFYLLLCCCAAWPSGLCL